MKILRFLLVMALFAIACQKEKKSIPSLGPGLWKIDGYTFSQDSSKWYQDSYRDLVVATSWIKSGRIGIGLGFVQAPEAGVYKIVYQPTAIDEVAIDAWQGGQNISYSKSNGEFLYVQKQDNVITCTATNIKLNHATWVMDYDVKCSLNLSFKY